MKKFFVLLLAAVMLLSLMGCGGEQAQEPEVQGLQTGFGREKITPSDNAYLQAVDRARLDPTMTMELKTLSVGDLSFVLAPYEMFGQHGYDIKTQSPYDNTFIITCAEGSFNYIASTEAFDYNSYESYCCYFEQGTGEKLVTEFVDMLTQMKNAQ